MPLPDSMLNGRHGKQKNAEVFSLNTSQVRGTLLISGRLLFNNETGKTAPLTSQGNFDGSGLWPFSVIYSTSV